MVAIEKHTFRHDGIDFHYTAAGAGEPVVLVHGGGSRASVFDPIIPRLAERFRVYAYDQRGFGDTGCTADGEITHQLWAEDLIAFLDHLGVQSAFVCGWSLGATVVMNAASQFPARIRALGLLGAPHPDRPLNREFFQRRLAQLQAGIAAEQIVDSLMDHIAAMFSPWSLEHRPGGLQVVRAEQLSNFPCAAQVTRSYETRPTFGPILEGIGDIPVTLIVGADDKTTDLDGARVLESRLKDCRTTIIPDCGHYFTLEHPDAAADALSEAFSRV